ncbi:MAG: preprotein translocase subunit SecG [Candidatus Wildermuthbacteria bacterium]|jgi:protein translocase SecG subunit|nr:preprotein translocase subunit SecG [Candidatus Wildermuthbacteria bacterium]
MNSYLLYVQIAIAVLLVSSILLQQRGTALGSSFGGGEGTFFATRRGIQQKLYVATIILGILFIALSLSNLLF